MKTSFKIFGYLFFKILLFVSLTAFHSTSNNKIYYSINSSSKLYIAGTTNVNSFKCNCEEPLAKGSFVLKENENNATLWKCQDAFLKVRTESFDCRNRLMNRDLYKAMKSSQYPYISIQLLEITQASPKKLSNLCEWVNFKAKVIITLTHVSKTIQIDVKGQNYAPGQFHFLANTDLKMTDFDITPPTAGLGLVKVRDKITVYMDIFTHVEK